MLFLLKSVNVGQKNIWQEASANTAMSSHKKRNGT